MARLIRALLDALNGDDDDDGTVSSLSSAASSPSRFVAAPRAVTRLSSSSSTDDRMELGDEVLEEMSNGFFRVARVPRLSDEGPTSSGEEKPAARSASASESEFFGAAVEGLSDEGFLDTSSVHVDVFHAGASGGVEDAAGVSLVPESLIDYAGGIDGGVMQSEDASEEKVEESELVMTDLPLVVDSTEGDAGFVLPDIDSDARDNTSKDEVITYVEDACLEHVARDDSDAKDNTSIHEVVTHVEDVSLEHVAGDEYNAKDDTSKHEVVTYVEAVSLEHVAGDDSDAKDNTFKHEVVTYVEYASLGHVAGDESDAKDNPYSITDCSHDKVDGESHGDYEASESVPIFETNNAVEFIRKDNPYSITDYGHDKVDRESHGDYEASESVPIFETNNAVEFIGKDNPYSITDYGHDKVDRESHGDYEASASMPIFETNDATEPLGKKLADNSSSEETCFDLDDFDGNHVNDDNGEEELFLRNDDEEGLNGKEADLSDYAALAELLSLSAPNISHGQGKANVFPVEISDSKQLPPTVVNTHRTDTTTTVLKVVAYPKSDMTDEEKQLYKKVDMARIKYLRLVHRLGYDTEHQAPIEVLYRLSTVEGLRRIRTANHYAELENAWKRVLQLEAEGIEDLEFSCNVLVLGKTGVGKSATINSIFGEDRSKTNAFLPATSSVNEITGVVGGVKFRVVDTPGLGTSIMDEKINRKLLRSVKTYIKRCPPDIVLYIDRIDTQRNDADDKFLLRLVTSVLGPSIWPKTIITLTHSTAPPPEGPDGLQLNYEMFVTHRARALQQSILQATKDTRIQNRVALVENHHLCQRNSEGEKVLPDGTIWRRELLLWCYSLKIVPEVDSLSTRYGAYASLFSPALPIPPLPCFLSSLMKSREYHKRACHPYDEHDTYKYPVQDLALPSSFDSDDPVYRYRYLEPTPNILVSFDPNPGMWDHDCGFDIVCLQHSIDVANTFPASMSTQVNKDKKEFTIHMESSISVKHGEHASSLTGFDIQTMMDQLVYTLRGETKSKSFKKNTTTGGLSMAFLGNTMVTGVKFEDKLSVGNRLTLVANTGAVTMEGDTAYGVNMEVNLCEKDYSMGQVLATLGTSLVRWHKEWTMAANLDSQFSMGRRSSMAFHLDLNNKLTGRVSIKANTSEQLTIALLGICSTVLHLWKRIHRNCE